MLVLTQYLSSEYDLQRLLHGGENNISTISPQEHHIHIFELSLLLYRHPDDSVFDDFPKISNHFPKISKDSIKLI